MTGTKLTMETRRAPTGLALTFHNWKASLRRPTPYLMALGIILWIGSYYLFVEGWKLPRFNKLPGPVEVISEWLSRDPDWGISLFSPEYYEHIFVSCRRIVIAFSIAMGILWLSTVPLTSGLVAVMFGTRYMGTLFSIVFFSHQVGSFLGVWMGGYLYDTTGSYMPVWWAGIIIGLLSALLHLPISERIVPVPAKAG